MKKGPRTTISEMILKSEEQSHFFTGLDKWSRQALWDFLGEAKYSLSIYHYTSKSGKQRKSGDLRALSVQCQFLMTLMILRRNYYFEEVSRLYNVNKYLVSKVFTTWICFIKCKYKDLDKHGLDQLFTKKCDIPKPLPTAFRKKNLSNTRVVIDCTELKIGES